MKISMYDLYFINGKNACASHSDSEMVIFSFAIMLELEHYIHIIYLLDRRGYESAICIKGIDRNLKHQSCEQELKDDERSLSLVRKACEVKIIKKRRSGHQDGPSTSRIRISPSSEASPPYSYSYPADRIPAAGLVLCSCRS